MHQYLPRLYYISCIAADIGKKLGIFDDLQLGVAWWLFKATILIQCKTCF